MTFVKQYLIAVVIFFSIDMVWLGVVAKKLYREQIGYLLSPSPNWIAAIVFYLLYIIGVVFFVVNPALEKSSWKYALLAGVFFGFITYATYDLTNLATIKDWPLKITIIDLLWGSFLGGSVSLLTYLIYSKLN